jgi:outer membrane lipoprotein SlyB
MIKNRSVPLRAQLGQIHPLMATAAVAVTLVSLVGIAAITGVIPSSHGTPAQMMGTTGMNGQAPMMSGAQNMPMSSAPMATQSPNYVPTEKPAYVTPAPEVKHVAAHQAASSHNSQNYAQDDYKVAEAVCGNCGRVESVVAVRHEGQGSGLGVAAGAVLGGVLGNQVGGGNGRTLATVAGAVAGGYGGNEVEKRTRGNTTYDVRVRMDNGHTRSFPQNGPDGWHVGDRVRVVNGALRSRG